MSLKIHLRTMFCLLALACCTNVVASDKQTFKLELSSQQPVVSSPRSELFTFARVLKAPPAYLFLAWRITKNGIIQAYSKDGHDKEDFYSHSRFSLPDFKWHDSYYDPKGKPFSAEEHQQLLDASARQVTLCRDILGADIVTATSLALRYGPKKTRRIVVITPQFNPDSARAKKDGMPDGNLLQVFKQSCDKGPHVSLPCSTKPGSSIGSLTTQPTDEKQD